MVTFDGAILGIYFFSSGLESLGAIFSKGFLGYEVGCYEATGSTMPVILGIFVGFTVAAEFFYLSVLYLSRVDFP